MVMVIATTETHHATMKAWKMQETPKLVEIKTRSPIYTAFYTVDTPYEEEVKRLQQSLIKHDLPHEIVGIQSLGSWQENTRYKAIFIQNMLYKHAGRPIVYLDSDAVIQSDPVFFNTLDCDVAAHYFVSPKRAQRELLSGTLYFSPTVNAKRLIQLWRYINQEYPHLLEQKNLEIALMFMPEVKVIELPASYCQIFDLMEDRGPPVIEHFQASRRFKKNIDNNIT